MAAGTTTSTSAHAAKPSGPKMESAKGDEDLSMEEILQSIRKIIAEDEPKKANATPAVEEDIPGSDVLELTEMINDDGTVVSLKSIAQDLAPGDVLSSIDQALVPEMPAAPALKREEAPPAPSPSVDIPFDAMPATQESAHAPITLPEESLLSDAASTAAVSSIKKLKSAEPDLPPLATTPSPHFRSGNSVEDMVADMLRPMMKSWLDQNLPQIVERIVEREVRKLTKYLSDNGN